METVRSAALETDIYTYEGFNDLNNVFDRVQIEAEAWQLINNRESFSSAEFRRQEYQDNARTALMEALTASGHLSRVEISGSIDDINHQVLSRLLNGWSNDLSFHEKQRRFAELCNELVIQKTHLAIASGEAPPGLAIAEISDYPITISDSEATSLGYRSSNRKGMLRSTHLQKNTDGSYTRIIEQISRANGTGSTSFRFFKAAGINFNKQKPGDIAVLEAPFVYSELDYVDGVVDIVRRLDSLDPAPVLYGDSLSRSQQHPPYQKLRQESDRREDQIEFFIDALANLEQQLKQSSEYRNWSEADRKKIFKEEVDRILSVICTVQPAYAEDTFGKKATPHFYEAARLEAAGQTFQAQQLLESTAHLKETVTFCGISMKVEEAQEKGLKVNSFAQLMEKARRNWKWEKGICIVPECPRAKKKQRVDVGPCSVCRDCQKIYDKGDDPKTVYKALGFLEWLFGLDKKNT